MSFEDDVYRLKYVIRYSNVPRVKDESVAEHGFFVAVLVMELHSTYDFDLGRALQMAIAHDIPEMELNDCPHVIKRKYPAIGRAYDLCEAEVMQTLPPAVRDGAMGYDNESEDTVEGLVVHLADVLQCRQYSKMEMQLGNKGRMAEIHSESVARISRLKGALVSYERSGK